METKHNLNLQITEDLKHKLENKASSQGHSLEEAALKILTEHFAPSHKDEKKATKNSQLPMVALVKNDFEIATELDKPPVQNQEISPASQPFGLIKASALAPIGSPSEPSSETLTRRRQIEAQMKELSLLITTADEDAKKAEYSMQYALLATELDSII
jgi:plasmid stability protein